MRIRYLHRYTMLAIAILGIAPLAYAHAASLSLVGAPERAEKGSVQVITLKLDPEGEFLNALEGNLRVTGPVTVAHVSTRHSIVGPWITAPAVASTTEGWSIVFAGIMPGGFDGLRRPLAPKPEPGTILMLYLVAEGPGIADVELASARMLKNDGIGTEVPAALTRAAYPIVVPRMFARWVVPVLGGVLVCMCALLYFFVRRWNARRRGSPQDTSANVSDDATM